MRAILIALPILWAGPALALELDCTARLACVTTLGACEPAEVPYALKVGRRTGDKVVLTTPDDESFYEFTRLPDAAGTLLQASGGALEEGQGAGAMTVFDDYRFVLTRHSLVRLGADGVAREAVAITILGTCEEPEQ
ncbi:hypothetical protein Ga0609869_002286 [Rhodovulum iodosum]|uniref:Uncharacterized protein n=1 Tax=Rhodovulum iodosum TaxID=68291 RepID=A0ABV3XV28_9RHOB|nr:hypothetical protein [Rhodovulum robiginosum]RSK34987.1 hypothetical protein EJA01_06200 [Rhodovulum robiginosum]